MQIRFQREARRATREYPFQTNEIKRIYDFFDAQSFRSQNPGQVYQSGIDAIINQFPNKQLSGGKLRGKGFSYIII